MGAMAGRSGWCRDLMLAAALSAGSLLVAACAVASATNAAGTGATTGGRSARLWVSSYNGTGNGTDRATSVAVGPAGHRVYVTGPSAGPGSKADYATVAYNAVTGARLWVSRYNGPGNGYDYATAVAVSPDGRTVYVTGSVYGGLVPVREYATVAFDAATGARRWVSTYPDESPYDHGLTWGPVRMVVSPDGRTVYVTGHAVRGVTSGGVPAYGFGTVAYAAATGAQLWARTSYTGNGLTTSLAVSPEGGTVYVSGSAGARLGLDTTAYDAATGAQRWASRGPPGQGWSLTVSPDGTHVFATGYARDRTSDYLTVGYDAATGKRMWDSRYGAPAFKDNAAAAAAISPDGRTVYVTGTSTGPAASQQDCATVAYAASTGAQLWSARYNSPANGPGAGTAIAVSHNGHTVYVTGFTTGAASGYNYLTIAYRA